MAAEERYPNTNIRGVLLDYGVYRTSTPVVNNNSGGYLAISPSERLIGGADIMRRSNGHAATP